MDDTSICDFCSHHSYISASNQLQSIEGTITQLIKNESTLHDIWLLQLDTHQTLVVPSDASSLTVGDYVQVANVRVISDGGVVLVCTRCSRWNLPAHQSMDQSLNVLRRYWWHRQAAIVCSELAGILSNRHFTDLEKNRSLYFLVEKALSSPVGDFVPLHAAPIANGLYIGMLSVDSDTGQYLFSTGTTSTPILLTEEHVHLIDKVVIIPCESTIKRSNILLSVCIQSVTHIGRYSRPADFDIYIITDIYPLSDSFSIAGLQMASIYSCTNYRDKSWRRIDIVSAASKSTASPHVVHQARREFQISFKTFATMFAHVGMLFASDSSGKLFRVHLQQDAQLVNRHTCQIPPRNGHILQVSVASVVSRHFKRTIDAVTMEPQCIKLALASDHTVSIISGLVHSAEMIDPSTLDPNLPASQSCLSIVLSDVDDMAHIVNVLLIHPFVYGHCRRSILPGAIIELHALKPFFGQHQSTLVSTLLSWCRIVSWRDCLSITDSALDYPFMYIYEIKTAMDFGGISSAQCQGRFLQLIAAEWDPIHHWTLKFTFSDGTGLLTAVLSGNDLVTSAFCHAAIPFDGSFSWTSTAEAAAPPILDVFIQRTASISEWIIRGRLIESTIINVSSIQQVDLFRAMVSLHQSNH